MRRYLDPHAAVLGVATIAVAWVAGVPAALGVAVGSVTFGIAAAGRVAQQARRDPPDGSPHVDAADEVALGTNEERWVRRGAEAVAAIDRGVRQLSDGAVRDRLTGVADQARQALEDLRVLAAKTSVTRTAARQLDAARLAADLTRLTTKLDQKVEPDAEEDLRRSLEAVREQLGIHRRLESTRKVLQGRVESGSLGLQRLAAQVGEVTTMTSLDELGTRGRRIEELSTQLQALQSGLSDAGALSRRAFGRIETEGGDR